MESMVAALIGLIAAVALYRYLRQRNATPQQRVAAMLRQVDGLTNDGVPEREALLRLLLTRPGWQELPADFLGPLIGRLESKEAVLRFVVLAEDCGYTKDKLPAIAATRPADKRLERVACLLAGFGFQLQSERRLKHAEFVQRLALALAPEHNFTNLPLAATLFELNRYAEARPLFERGIHRIEPVAAKGGLLGDEPVIECLSDRVDQAGLLQSYRDLHARCVKALESGQGC